MLMDISNTAPTSWNTMVISKNTLICQWTYMKLVRTCRPHGHRLIYIYTYIYIYIYIYLFIYIIYIYTCGIYLYMCEHPTCVQGPTWGTHDWVWGWGGYNYECHPVGYYHQQVMSQKCVNILPMEWSMNIWSTVCPHVLQTPWDTCGYTGTHTASITRPHWCIWTLLVW